MRLSDPASRAHAEGRNHQPDRWPSARPGRRVRVVDGAAGGRATRDGRAATPWLPPPRGWRARRCGDGPSCRLQRRRPPPRSWRCSRPLRCGWGRWPVRGRLEVVELGERFSRRRHGRASDPPPPRAGPAVSREAGVVDRVGEPPPEAVAAPHPQLVGAPHRPRRTHSDRLRRPCSALAPPGRSGCAQAPAARLVRTRAPAAPGGAGPGPPRRPRRRGPPAGAGGPRCRG